MTIRVFVGCAPNNDDLESMAVLEHSLRSRCSLPVEITWMRLSRDLRSPFYSDGPQGWQTRLWATPFSGFRWAVPALCNFEGLAVYCDSDTIWLADAAELWRQQFAPGRVVLAKGGEDSWRFCVTLWDCAAAGRVLPPVSQVRDRLASHRELIHFFKTHRELVQPFRGNWNCIDGEDYDDLGDPDVKVLHYSSEAHQPQLAHAIPRLAAAGQRHWFDGQVRQHWRADVVRLFEEELAAARAADFSPEDYWTEPYGNYAKASQKNYQTNRWGARAGA